jgi:hypothetical protein
MSHADFEIAVIAVAVIIALIIIYVFNVLPPPNIVAPISEIVYTVPDAITYYNPENTAMKVVEFPTGSGLQNTPTDHTATCNGQVPNPWDQPIVGLDTWFQSQYKYANNALNDPQFTSGTTPTSVNVYDNHNGTLTDTALSNINLQCAAENVHVDTSIKPLNNNCAQYYMQSSTWAVNPSTNINERVPGADASVYEPGVNWNCDYDPLLWQRKAISPIPTLDSTLHYPANDGGIYLQDNANMPEAYLRGLEIGVDPSTGKIYTITGLTEDGTRTTTAGTAIGPTNVSRAWCDPFNAIVGVNAHYNKSDPHDNWSGTVNQYIDNLELLCSPVM